MYRPDALPIDGTSVAIAVEANGGFQVTTIQSVDRVMKTALLIDSADRWQRIIDARRPTLFRKGGQHGFLRGRGNGASHDRPTLARYIESNSLELRNRVHAPNAQALRVCEVLLGTTLAPDYYHRIKTYDDE